MTDSLRTIKSACLRPKGWTLGFFVLGALASSSLMACISRDPLAGAENCPEKKVKSAASGESAQSSSKDTAENKDKEKSASKSTNKEEETDSGDGPVVSCDWSDLKFDGVPDCQPLQAFPEPQPGRGAAWFSFPLAKDDSKDPYGESARLARDGHRVLVSGALGPLVIDFQEATVCMYEGLGAEGYRVSSVAGTGDGTHFVVSYGNKKSPDQKIQVFAYDKGKGHTASLPPAPEYEESTWGELLAIKRPGSQERLLVSTHGYNISMIVSRDCGLTWTRASEGNVSNFYAFDAERANKTLWMVSGPVPDTHPIVLRKAVHELDDGKGWEGTILPGWQDDQVTALAKNPHRDESVYFVTPGRLGRLDFTQDAGIASKEIWQAKGDGKIRYISQIWADPRHEGDLILVGTPNASGGVVALRVSSGGGAQPLEWQGDGPLSVDDLIEFEQKELLLFSSQSDDKIDFFVHSSKF